MTRYADNQELLKLAQDLKTETDRVGRENADELRKTGRAIAKRGAELAPRGQRKHTGQKLAESIAFDEYGSGRSARGMTIVVGPSARHGKFVEFGTVKMAPQPFMLPAFQQHAPAFEQRIADIAGGILP